MRAKHSILLSILLGLLSGCVDSADSVVTPPTSLPAAIAAAQPLTATEILQATSRCYAGFDSIKVDVFETMSVDRPDAREMAAHHVAAQVARPNRLSLTGISSGPSFHADGNQLWTVLGDRYSREPCPASLTLVTDDPIRSSLLPLGSLFLLTLLADDAESAMTRDIESVEVLAEESLDGILTHHLRFIQAEFDWELWIAVEEPQLIQRVVYDMSKQLGVDLADTEVDRIKTTIRFENWQTNVPLNEADFVFEPRAGDREVEHVMGIGRGG